MTDSLSDVELEAYLDEALPVDEMTRIEDRLRGDPREAQRLAQVVARRDSGVHTLGAIWRRRRLTCPRRDELGAFLLRTLDPSVESFIQAHLEVVGCRICQANLEDLRDRLSSSSSPVDLRRRKYFQSSAGLLPKK